MGLPLPATLMTAMEVHIPRVHRHYYNAEELAAYFHLSTGTVYAMLRTGKVRATNDGGTYFVEVEEVEEIERIAQMIPNLPRNKWIQTVYQLRNTDESEYQAWLDASRAAKGSSTANK